jgi:CBS domain containing-hemolysin-like protein
MPIRQVRDGVWHVTGMTRLWRLCRYFDIEGPRAKSHTVAGMVQEELGRLPERGDRGRWGDFEFEVVDVPDFGELVIELTRAQPVEGNE